MLDPAIVDLLKQLIPVLTVVAGASITLFITWINNRHTRSLQRDQWEREDQKAQKEAQRLEVQKAIDQKQQERQSIIDNYAQAVAHLSVIANTENNPLHPENLKALKEVQPYLMHILLTYPDRENYDYQSIDNEVSSLSEKATQTFHVAKELRGYILDLAKSDPRLQEDD